MLPIIYGKTFYPSFIGVGATDDVVVANPSWPSQAAVQVMRFVLLAVALFLLGSCAAPVPSSNQNVADKSGLYRFIEPTNGAAYSQGSISYYLPPGLGR